MVRSSLSRHLVHDRVTHGSHAQRDLHRHAFHLALRRLGGDVAFPRTSQRFQVVEGLLRVRLWRVSLLRVSLVSVSLGKSHGGERHQNYGQHKTEGFHFSFSCVFNQPVGPLARHMLIYLTITLCILSSLFFLYL